MYMACHECDLLEEIPPVAERARATCSRCGAVLYRHKRNSIERTLALTIAALLLYVVANSYPLLTFDLKGDTTQATLISGVQLLYESHKPFVATVVLLTSIVAPGLQIAALLYVFVPLYLDRNIGLIGRANDFL